MIEIIGYAGWLLITVYLTYLASVIAAAAWDVKYPDKSLMVAALVVIASTMANWYGLYSSPLLAPFIERLL